MKHTIILLSLLAMTESIINASFAGNSRFEDTLDRWENENLIQVDNNPHQPEISASTSNRNQSLPSICRGMQVPQLFPLQQSATNLELEALKESHKALEEKCMRLEVDHDNLLKRITTLSEQTEHEISVRTKADNKKSKEIATLQKKHQAIVQAFTALQQTIEKPRSCFTLLSECFCCCF